MYEDDSKENRADLRVPSGGWSRSGDGNDNDDSEGEEDTQGAEKGTGKGKGTKNGKGNVKAIEDRKEKGKGKAKWNIKGKGIVKQAPGGDVISGDFALQLQKEMYEADLDTEG